MASNVRNITCIKDGYFNQYGSSSGSSYQLKVGGQINMPVPSAYEKNVSVLAFDLSSIGLGKTITRIVLNLNVEDLYDAVEGMSAYSRYSTSVLTEMFNREPFVISARKLNTYTMAEIESGNNSVISNKQNEENLFNKLTSPLDTSKNLSWVRGGTSIDINYGEIVNNEIIIGLLIDYNFSNTTSRNMFAKISSRESSNSPTISVYYDDYEPQAPYDLKPSATARNKAGVINLSWEFDDLGTGATQNLAEVVYSTDNFNTSTTKIISGIQNYYTITANTFSNGQTVYWKVRVTDTNGDVSSYSSTATFTIGATLPSVPLNLSPSDTIVNSSDDISLRWTFNDLYGYKQGGYDVEYNKIGESVTTVHINSSISKYTIPKNTFTGGDYRWRVRTYNEFGEMGTYSPYAYMYSIGKPKSPTINGATNNCRPTIFWSATEQDIFIIKLYQNNELVYDSEEKAGEIYSYQIPEYLNNGAYTVTIQTANIYGFWSDISTFRFNINVPALTKPNLVIGKDNLITSLVIDSEATKNLIYRKSKFDDKFILLEEMNNGTSYSDYTVASGENEYFIRAVSDNSFSDSDIKKVDIDIKGIVLSDSKDLTKYINLKQTYGEDKRRNISLTKAQYLIKCNGRKNPILQSEDFQNYSESYEYFVKDLDEVISLIENTEIYLFRNSRGHSFYAQLSNVSINENQFGYTIAFTITQVDRS